MKTGIAQIEAVSVFCPECHEAFDGTSNGSTMITADDSLKGGQTVSCPCCEAKYKLPGIISRIGK